MGNIKNIVNDFFSNKTHNSLTSYMISYKNAYYIDHEFGITYILSFMVKGIGFMMNLLILKKALKEGNFENGNRQLVLSRNTIFNQNSKKKTRRNKIKNKIKRPFLHAAFFYRGYFLSEYGLFVRSFVSSPN